MKKALSTLLAAALVLSVFTTVFTVSAFAEEPENVKVITNASELADAVANQQPNETWKLAEGTYNLTQAHLDQYKAWNEPGQGNWYFPIHEEGITIIGEGDVTVTSDVESKNGAWATQDFISVWADNVTIDNVDILSKKEQNKAIEVMAKNFTLKNSEIKKVNEDGSGSIYFNAINDEKDIGNATITATCGDVSAVCEITVTAPTEMPDTNDSNMTVAGICAALVLAAACAFAYRKRA